MRLWLRQAWCGLRRNHTPRTLLGARERGHGLDEARYRCQRCGHEGGYE